jgi:hypothetical protein
MTQKKTLQDREKELRLLVATPAGLEAVEELASRYAVVSGRLKPAGRSAVTYILVHERGQGLISG